MDKVFHMIGTSSVSWEDAARNALRRARKTLMGLRRFEAVRFAGKIEGDRVVEYEVELRVGFEIVDEVDLHQ